MKAFVATLVLRLKSAFGVEPCPHWADYLREGAKR